MSVFYHLESEHFLENYFHNVIDPIKQNLQSGKFHLLPHEEKKVLLPFDVPFDEEDFFLVDDIFPLFSDSLYQNIRTLISERSESYYIPGRFTLIFEGRHYGYIPIVPSPVNCFRQDGSFNPVAIGYLPIFWRGNQLCCTELCANRLMTFRPHGLVINQLN